MKNKYYYDIADDLIESIWAYIIIGGRNTGKTYSALKYVMQNHIKFVFLKRTMDDVDLLCAGSGRVGKNKTGFGVDLSPFKSINRDYNTNITAFSIRKGLGGFWDCDEDGNPIGAPIGYLISLSAVSKFKGFDLSDCDILIFDEFIPQPWDRVNVKEGEQLLDLYKTISRDREHRGKEPLKLWCLANATSISNPVMNILELTDTVAKMQSTGEEKILDNDRGILIHTIHDNKEFTQKEKESQLYRAMGNTSWGRMAFDNEFAYNDFTSVGRLKLKNFSPVCSILYKNKKWYVWRKDNLFYVTTSRHEANESYDLSKENDQKLFYINRQIDFKNSCIEGNMIFEVYTMYDVIINYRKFFKV